MSKEKNTPAQNVDLVSLPPLTEPVKTSNSISTSESQERPTTSESLNVSKNSEQNGNESTKPKETAKDRLKKKAASTSSSSAATDIRKETAGTVPPKRGRPTGTTKDVIEERKELQPEIFTRDNIKFYAEMFNRLLSQIDMHCSGSELNNFLDPLHRIANKKLGSAKFLNTDEGQIAILALATFGPKVPKGIKAIRGKFGNGNIRNVQTRQDLSSEQKGGEDGPGNLHRPDGAVLRRLDFHDDQRPAAIL